MLAHEGRDVFCPVSYPQHWERHIRINYRKQLANYTPGTFESVLHWLNNSIVITLWDKYRCSSILQMKEAKYCFPNHTASKWLLTMASVLASQLDLSEKSVLSADAAFLGSLRPNTSLLSDAHFASVKCQQ